MKSVKFVPDKQNNKEWRFRWYHVLICSVLIAAVFVTMSVGLGYARFLVDTAPLEAEYTVKGNVASSDCVVAQRIPGEDTVLVSNDGKLKITVPATAEGDVLDNADYLMLRVTSSVNDLNKYNLENWQNRVSYSVQLQSAAYDDAQNSYPFIVDNNNSIIVELNIGHDVDIGDRAFYISAPDPSPNYSYNSETGFVSFTGIGSLTAENGTYDVEFDRVTITPDTSWYSDSYDAFVINSPAALAGVAKLVNDGTTDFLNKTIQLGEDISLYNQDNSKYTWDPIGNDKFKFRGSFDGDGHTISGLNLRVFYDTVISEPEEKADRTCGLFGEVDGDGTNFIKNVTLKDVSCSADLGTFPDSEEGQAFGALAGYTHGVNISDIHVDGLSVYGGAGYIGGILGRGDSDGSLSDCSVENAVFDVCGADYVGGIVGLQFGNGQDMLRNCYVSAEINGNYNNAGGIVGLAFGQNGAVGVDSCYFIGSFGHTDDDAKCGGIVGVASSSVDKAYVILNCYSDCDVDLFGFGYFGYHVYKDERSLDEEKLLLGNRIEMYDSSWSGDNDEFEWSSYCRLVYDFGNGKCMKFNSCPYTAGMSYSDFLQEQNHGGDPAVTATDAPTEAPSAAPTVSATE